MLVDGRSAPIVWRACFDPHISRALVTYDNPSGTLSISDFELAGMIAHKDVLAHAHDIREQTIWLAGDNRAAISWSDKGSSMSVAARAYLLRYNALHQRHYRYLSRHHYIPGPVNAMADAASRRWDLSDSDFLTHFNTVYPQDISWTLHPLANATKSALTGALCKTRRRHGFLGSAPPAPTPVGNYGSSSAPALISAPIDWAATPSPSYSFLHNAIAPKRSHPAASLSALAQWRTPYERWDGRTPGWGPRTLV